MMPTHDAAGGRFQESDVLCRQTGSLGVLELQRPARLNALDRAMVDRMQAALAAWRDDASVRAVLICGAQPHVFCAGGDVRAIARAPFEAGTFLDRLYTLAATVATYPKPIVAVLRGVAMGAGLGLALLAHHRVVGERARLAMPETLIGHYPDTGTTWAFPRLPDRVGLCLGLTGWEVGPGDALHLGLVDSHVPDDRHADLEAALTALPRGSGTAPCVRGAIGRMAAPLPVGPLTRIRPGIRRVFGYRRYADIRAALAAEPRPWARAAAQRLDGNAPTAVKVALEAMQIGARSSLADSLTLERRLTGAMVVRPDFQEGVRARLVDKDDAPVWQPAEPAAVPDAPVQALVPAVDSDAVHATQRRASGPAPAMTTRSPANEPSRS